MENTVNTTTRTKSSCVNYKVETLNHIRLGWQEAGWVTLEARFVTTYRFYDLCVVYAYPPQVSPAVTARP